VDEAPLARERSPSACPTTPSTSPKKALDNLLYPRRRRVLGE
jgi:hypothetical protein